MAANVWARVKDKTTGHHFDVTLGRLQRLIDRGVVEEVADGALRHRKVGERHPGNPCAHKLQRPLSTLVSPAKRAAKPPAAVAEQKESESA